MALTSRARLVFWVVKRKGIAVLIACRTRQYDCNGRDLLWWMVFSGDSILSGRFRSFIVGGYASVTIVLWSLSPIVWLLGTEGFGAFGLAWGIIFLLVLGLLAMVGFLLLTNRQALGEISGGTAQPSRVR